MSKKTLQALIVNCMLMGVLYASDTNAQQIRSVKDVVVKFHVENSALERVLRSIEEQTDFEFTYRKEDVDQEFLFSGKFTKASVADVLLEVSRQTDLKFKQVNNNIHISKKSSNARSDKEIEIVIQGITITGKVISSEDDQGLPGVNVIVKGTSQGTVTDVEGNYSLDVPDQNSVLIFSSVGYVQEEVMVGDQTVINLSLVPDLTTLEEIIVVGFGEQKRANKTGAVTQFDSKVIAGRPITSASQVLQGVTPGAFVSQGSSQPGADNTRIRIRGVSLRLDGVGSNDPYILVDGVEASFNDINPSDIETVTILKDAAAAAIYGSRAANGVILITTKRGSSGGLKVEYAGFAGFQRATTLPDVISNSVQYMELYNEALANRGAKPAYSQETIDAYRNDPSLPNQNWFDLVYRDAKIQQHSLSLKGGSEGMRMFFSLGYLDQEGIQIRNNSDRVNMRFNLDSKVSDKINVGINMAGSSQKTFQGGFHSFGDPTNIFLETMSANPTTTHAVSGDGAYVSPRIGGSSNRNPIANLETGDRERRTQQFNGAIFGELEIIEGLKLRGQASYRMMNRHEKLFVKPIVQFANTTTLDNGAIVWNNDIPDNAVSETNQNNRRTALTRSNSTTHQYNMFATLTYEKQFGDHGIMALLGVQDEWFTGEGLEAKIEFGFPDPITEFPGGSSDVNNQFVSRNNRFVPNEWIVRSVFSRVNYDFQGKYLFEANLRMDQSSRFHPDNRTGYFPSFSAGWRLSEESFFDGLRSTVNNLKLRGSWGILGEQRGNEAYAYISSISNSDGYIFSEGAGETTGKSINNLRDVNTVWQKNRTYNIGLEAGFFDGKLNVEADYFVKDNIDQLARVQLVSLAGVNAPIGNPFSIQNKGWEFVVSHRNKIGEVEYSIGANFSKILNEVTNLKQDTIFESRGKTITTEGLPIRSNYLYIWDGIIQTQAELDELNSGSPTGTYQRSNTGVGDLKFKDINKDGRITPDDRTVVGKPYPGWTFGFNLSLRYKGFDLSALFQGVIDYDIYADSWGLDAFQQGSITSFWLDRWTPENPSTTKPRLLDGRGGFSNNRPKTYPSTFYFFSGSYLRAKNIQVGYSLPSSVTDKISIGSVRVYLNAQNPFITTNFVNGFDPERFSSTDPGSARSRERVGSYPQAKIFTVGLNVKF